MSNFLQVVGFDPLLIQNTTPSNIAGPQGPAGPQGVAGPPGLPGAVHTVDGQFGDVSLAGKYAPPAVVPAESLHAWGHSYISGSSSDGGTLAQTLAPTLAELLGLPLRNDGIGGSLMSDSLKGTGFVLQAVARHDLSGSGREGYRFTPGIGLHVLMHGLNDIGAYGGNTGVLHCKEAMRVAVSRFRAAAIYEDTDASVTYTGTWTVFAATDRNSGSGLHYSATVGNSFTITTPADFPGGTLALGFTSWSDGGATIQSQAINGTVYSINTAAIYATTYYQGSVLRIPNVPAGSASYTFTVTAVTGGIGCMFDYWQWEPDATAGPLVVLVKQPKIVDYTPFTQAVIGDADVDLLNNSIDNIATEFGGRVMAVSTSSIDKDPTCFVTGNVHPTRKGHRLIAGLIASAIQPLVRYQATRPLDAPRELPAATAAPTSTTGATYYPGDTVRNASPVETGTAGSKYVVTGWICTAAGQPGTWLPLRALTGN